MVTHGRVELLAHPLSQKYLQMKWNSYGKYFHLANLLFYCVFLMFVTMYTCMLVVHVDSSIVPPNSSTMGHEANNPEHEVNEVNYEEASGVTTFQGGMNTFSFYTLHSYIFEAIIA